MKRVYNEVSVQLVMNYIKYVARTLRSASSLLGTYGRLPLNNFQSARC